MSFEERLELSEAESKALDIERLTWQQIAKARQNVIESLNSKFERLRSKLYVNNDKLRIMRETLAERDKEITQLRYQLNVARRGSP